MIWRKKKQGKDRKYELLRKYIEEINNNVREEMERKERERKLEEDIREAFDNFGIKFEAFPRCFPEKYQGIVVSMLLSGDIQVKLSDSEFEDYLRIYCKDGMITLSGKPFSDRWEKTDNNSVYFEIRNMRDNEVYEGRLRVGGLGKEFVSRLRAVYDAINSDSLSERYMAETLADFQRIAKSVLDRNPKIKLGEKYEIIVY